jgi:hypothetical protein
MWQSEEKCSDVFIFFIVSVIGNWKNGNPWRHIIAQTMMGGIRTYLQCAKFSENKAIMALLRLLVHWGMTEDGISELSWFMLCK